VAIAGLSAGGPPNKSPHLSGAAILVPRGTKVLQAARQVSFEAYVARLSFGLLDEPLDELLVGERSRVGNAPIEAVHHGVEAYRAWC